MITALPSWWGDPIIPIRETQEVRVGACKQQKDSWSLVRFSTVEASQGRYHITQLIPKSMDPISTDSIHHKSKIFLKKKVTVLVLNMYKLSPPLFFIQYHSMGIYVALTLY